MSITSTDLKLFASAYPLDTDYGGGGMISTVVQNGTENNLFPDIDAAARAGGRVQLRKVYAAVTSADMDVFSGAQISVKVKPTDAAVGIVAFATGDQTTLRKAAETALQTFPYRGLYFSTVTGTPPYYVDHVTTNISPPLGTLLGVFGNGAVGLLAVGVVTAVAGGAGAYDVTLSMRYGFAGQSAATATVSDMAAALTAAPRCVAAVTSTAVSTSTGITVPVEARVVPNITPYPLVVNGLTALPNYSDLTRNAGKVPIFRNGDTVVLRNGATTETAQVLFVDYRGALTFTAALVNSYPIGSTVSALLQLGDMQPVVAGSFSQQTWTRVFSDSIIGNTISANYNRVAGTITTSNLGAATERWAIVFTGTTTFKLIGEVVGQIATGDIATAFLPLNPITATPYFTIPTAGWGAGWATGNVLRFNTVGSRAPFWVARTVSPSAVGAVLDGSTLEIRGTINA